MISPTGVPHIPMHRGAAAAADWTDNAVMVVVMAIAFGAMYVMGRQPAKWRTTPARAKRQRPQGSLTALPHLRANARGESS